MFFILFRIKRIRLQNDRKTRFPLARSFFKSSKREGKTALLLLFSAGERMFKQGKVQVFPHQIAGFSLKKVYVFPRKKQCLAREKAMFSPFSDFEAFVSEFPLPGRAAFRPIFLPEFL